MRITIPDLSLVLLMGASGAGKSSFAKKHFLSTEILSSDHYRGVVSDDETDQSASKDAFDVLHYIAAKRLAAGKLTVIDATNVQIEARKPLLKLAKDYHFFVVAIALNLPAEVCLARNKQRPDRQFGPHVVRNHVENLQRSLRNFKREKIRHSYVLNSLEEINAVEIERQPLWNNRKEDPGPFDIIGDVHGCCDEVEQLLQKLGYLKEQEITDPDNFWCFPTYYHPEGRKAVFLGDLIDRGPRILDTLKLVHNMMSGCSGMCIMGNHENKLMRKLSGKNVKVSYGLAQTLAAIEAIDDSRRDHDTEAIQSFLDSLISHYVFDEGKLVVAHAGLKENLQGRESGYVRSFALYGETTGETDKFGLPIRHNWAADYRGKATVVYGHTPVLEPEWLNNTIDIDTGCVYGGKLTALRYPEKELVSVPAAKMYREPKKPLDKGDPFGTQERQLSAQQGHDNVLDISDVLGKRVLATRLYKKITIREENAIAALEVMSRFAVNPKWLIYLPPTMAPAATTQRPHLLEHPAEAFDYYRQQGIDSVVCEEKHMGSRVVVIVCRDRSVAENRFGITDEGTGICYTRTGRRFFKDRQLEAQMISRVSEALSHSRFWERNDTDWVCLDCELMPWSEKAQSLIKQQYAPVGAAAQKSLSSAVASLQQAANHGVDVSALLTRYQQRANLADKYVDAYRRYCWPVNDLSDLILAPFHVLATEGKVHSDKTHDWHMQQIAQFAQAAPELLVATEYKTIYLQDEASCNTGIQWWESLTESGGEGMVVKPMDFIHRGQKGFAQPAVKCRGAEYLRIIYGPEYTLPENLERLRKRGLSRKRSLALREFSLGMESLARFVEKEPLRKVHECVFGVLALESEPVDPRL